MPGETLAVNFSLPELLLLAAFVVPVVYGIRFARREPRVDPNPGGTTALLVGAWFLTVGVLFLPVLFLASFVLGGMLVSRGRVLNGWAIMGVSLVLAAARVVLVLAA